ncbi:MAG: DNA-dependent RNA polymerase II [Trichoglossum hirsutum]|nr:MAG: DNA-dependent RNA polymerase II [Trichoglossum hirsutum]
MAYEVQSSKEAELLEAYEINRSENTACRIELEDGTNVRGRTFKWQGRMEDLVERVFDLRDWQIRIFIINGSGKVHEKSAANNVQVFKKAPPSPTPFVAEIRSAVEKGSEPISGKQIKLFARGEGVKEALDKLLN